ncbi:MAG TPA: O-antigen ligase family protein [Niabella sp.]
MWWSFQTIKLSKKEYTFIALGAITAILFCILSVWKGDILFFFIPVMLLVAFAFLVILFREPLTGLITTMVYCFLMGIPAREIGGLAYGIGIELFLLLTWLSVWYNAKRYDLSVLRNDLIVLFLVWFALSVLEIVNPSGATVRGWLQEIRSAALYPILIAGLGSVLLNKKKHVNIFIRLVVALSLLAAFNGIKQKYIGPSRGEQAFLDNGGAETHILGGQLRVFSFYQDAGQFGASMAEFIVIALVLAIGLKRFGKRAFYFLCVPIFAYAMLISGTRGSFFALIFGAAFALLLTRNFKALIIGTLFLAAFIGFLKFTTIGNTNYGIFRLRTAVDPQDASLNLRFINQQKLSEYLKTKPLGGGLGVIGAFGHKYNPGQFLSTIEPDSYWVKVWAMYGIVGFTFWFCMMMYLLGKCCGFIWRIRDPDLKVKMIALGAGVAGIFLCSYGNEVINNMPSSIIVNLSFAIIFNAAKIEENEKQSTIDAVAL